jgi:hypothetical protein
MIWLILTILIASYIIGEAIKHAADTNRVAQNQALNTQQAQEKQKLQREIDSKYPPGSDGFKLIKNYVEIEARIWMNQQNSVRITEAVEREAKGTNWSDSSETLMKENKERYSEILKLRKEYAELSKKLGYEATDILTDDWPERLRMVWENLEQKKLDSFKRMMAKS